MVLQCLAACYAGREFPDVSLDRFAPMCNVLEAMAHNPVPKSLRPVRFKVASESAVSMFLYVLGLQLLCFLSC